MAAHTLKQSLEEGEAPLLFAETKYERKVGLLALTNQRVLWMKRGDFVPELKIAVDRVRKVQSNEKEDGADAKVKVLEHGHEDGSGGFLFSFVEKHDKWVYRDTFRDLLEQLISTEPGTKRRMPQQSVVTAKRRAQLVATDADLREVREKFMDPKKTSGAEPVLREEEFWSVRSAPREKQILDGEESARGLPTAMLDTPRPSTDASCNESRYCLTVDMIESIFRSYPDVRKEFLLRVPHEMSERAFWKKYILARFFNRGKADARSKVDKLEQVAASAQPVLPEVELPEEVRFNPRVNLDANLLLPRGFGIQPDRVMQDSQLRNALPTIARFNSHSHEVVHAQRLARNHAARPSIDVALERRERTGTVPLTVPDYRCYFASDKSHPSASAEAFDRLIAAVDSLRYESFDDAVEAVDGDACSRVLDRITLQCRERRKHIAEGKIVANKQHRNVYKLAHELLRHFWGCFPLSSAQKRERMQRLLSSIVKMRKKLETLAQSKGQQKLSFLQPITEQLSCAVARAESVTSSN